MVYLTLIIIIFLLIYSVLQMGCIELKKKNQHKLLKSNKIGGKFEETNQKDKTQTLQKSSQINIPSDQSSQDIILIVPKLQQMIKDQTKKFNIKKKKYYDFEINLKSTDFQWLLQNNQVYRVPSNIIDLEYEDVVFTLESYRKSKQYHTAPQLNNDLDLRVKF